MVLCERTTFNLHPGALIPFFVCIRNELFEYVFSRPDSEQKRASPYSLYKCPRFFVCPVSRDGAFSS